MSLILISMKRKFLKAFQSKGQINITKKVLQANDGNCEVMLLCSNK